MNKKAFLVLATTFLIFVTLACRNVVDGGVNTTTEPTPGLDKISLPALSDLPENQDGAHSNRLEWWYYNGHLDADDGTYGYHFTVFKYEQSSLLTPLYTTHYSLITPTGEHLHGSLLPRKVGGNDQNCPFVQEDELLMVGSSDWCLSISENSHRFFLDTLVEGVVPLKINLELNPLSSTRIVHNEVGWFEYLGWSYYYSYPRMETTGEIKIDEREIEVLGTSWFDHQWGDFIVVGSPAGWQWMALLLDDGSSLKVTLARGTSGEVALKYATLQKKSGETIHIEGDEFVLNVTDFWESENTGASYPSSWELQIPSIGVDLSLSPTFSSQEVYILTPSTSAYWEGRVVLEGSHSGVGYVELSGYTEPEEIAWLN